MGGDYQDLSKSTVLLYYKRPEIQQAIASFAENKEVVGSFGGKGYAKRPDIIQFSNDVFEQVKRGVTSFHMSEETWSNPLLLEAGVRKQDLDKLRTGWDLILDLDSPFFELSRIAADFIIQALRFNGISSVTVKFSGNHGFHIAVPFESFPKTVHGIPTEQLFPEGPKKIAEYLSDMVREHLAKKILSDIGQARLEKELGKPYEEFVVNSQFDPFKTVSIDTVLISSRHLFRMPFSLNEKSGLVSLPLNPEQVAAFTREQAEPEKVTTTAPFLDRSKAKPNEAERLFISAFDFVTKKQPVLAEEKGKMITSFGDIQEKIPEELFPPCIKKILGGIADGKKRSLFILVNFLRSCGWSYEEIEECLVTWSKACPEPIKEVLIKGHLRYHKLQNKKVLPPNCDNKGYYKDMGFCMPDSFCSKISNPASYSRKKRFLIDQHKPKKNEKKTAKGS